MGPAQEVEIRSYREEDWASLCKIHDRSRMVELRLAGLEKAFLPLSDPAEREGLAGLTILVACVNGRICGFTAYSEDKLTWLYVDPLFCGQGIGKKLLAHVIAHTTRRPFSIEVLVGNTPALHLYEKMGFRKRKICSGVLPGIQQYSAQVQCMELVNERGNRYESIDTDGKLATRLV